MPGNANELNSDDEMERELREIEELELRQMEIKQRLLRQHQEQLNADAQGQALVAGGSMQVVMAQPVVFQAQDALQ